ncbi:MAG: threonine--tRNA ligase [Parcubacteria group bacterium CG1_02_40_82]|uniref:Threonine--tRNA ligase n=4 Tax=Candidatus Portnoyibacteriota TaxID=1817913 RepID=A0A2M7IJ96_9BACT|nr:MAG: threonine--tRNA ligase [Parcubacteria group bacterium CG1_02_40_82]PIQ74860.1 MAG: threonine--tRNA ligase [Candidatus Portnoybacteria bacterium CG11_big_fil_rev_8_21_14_0_20_40_15]PIS31596.1 MAG: threonine--tRNA ligase [Candidatus Portnoybacteria bacterium CG08_land_8_20_14_0_20_40_83]PIW76610.1 MAG: threonine--tRNA ligase [Candidatus Portnoybacteria bacterium CG_4_8_14_3_um_filter_40_10]PIY75432.1 MAG: threonine--tRNA ligase [Candidatus Portnoybacteria bacterium CG_4_10_14_0_8_um_filte
MENKNNKLDILRHSTSHILASAVLDMFPEAKFGIGPTVEGGFYYDFDLPRTLIPEDLPILEEKIRAIIKQNLAFEKKQIDVKKAQELFKKAKQPYKVELIKDLVKEEKATLRQAQGKKVTIYKTGNFVDLCRGPHIDSTGEIKSDAFKLLKIAGAYWRGSEKNKMLQRIYGTAFENKKDLEAYLKKLEEAEKRDHRKLGKDLDLFSLPELAGGGLPVWHPKGAVVRQTIEDFWKKEHQAKDYKLVYSPHIGNINIWKKSGHWDFYRENLYSPIKIDTEEYLLKPMNCPFHIFVYQSQTRSYKDLPLRYAELGTVYRYERSGVLHGLTRVRGFTQDDAHIFCTPEQLSEELVRIIEFAVKMLKVFGFSDYDIFLSTRPEKFIGNEKIWDKATKALKYALDKTGLKYQIDPGEGVFYGPKIDIKIKDALDRAWQCTTIQVDFNLPERFDVSYIDEKGKKQQPIMIHRALLGSLERFIGVLIEHYAGAFPVWLAPEQVWILPIGSRHKEYALKVAEALKQQNIRVVVKNENETIGKKIRDGELQKIPYLLVVGDKEISAESVAVRERGKGDLGPIKLDKFIEKIIDEIKIKK